jgi:hypothetical protein
VKNFIVITTNLSCPVDLGWGHNDQELTQGPWLPNMEICINHCESNNVLWIENKSDQEYEIDDITMYGFGQGKIKYWGRFSPADGGSSWSSHVIHKHGKWFITWQYPTFTWLHKSLGMGWLVKPDNP